MKSKYELLKKMCAIHAPSGNEDGMTEFLLKYISKEMKHWKHQPEVLHGGHFQNCIVLVFGNPRTAMYAHIDNIGFMARYQNELIKIGGPRTMTGYKLVGSDKKGIIKVKLEADTDTDKLKAICKKKIEPGTDFSFESDFRETTNFVQSCYLDNRLGVFVALQTARTLENGVIVFSAWEEHGGGSAGSIATFLFQNYGISQSLISDITWITEGVHHGEGVVVSIRDSGIPRRRYVNRIRKILDSHKFKYQTEVESHGGSDGNDIQKSPYPIDWCFIGAPEDFVHSPDEKVHKKDIVSMEKAYKILMQEL